MKVAGIDVGTRNTKAVILNDGRMLSYGIVRSEETPEENARRANEAALAKAGVSWEEIQYIVSTGLGSELIRFSHKNQKNPLLCLAKGAHRLFPSARTVLDIGANNSYAISIDERGSVDDFALGDQCAAGTGILFEALVDLLDTPLEELSLLPVSFDERVQMSDTCVIFMEQEVISLLHAVPPVPLEEIVYGIYRSLVSRVKGLITKIRTMPDILICGGVVKNDAFFNVLEKEMGIRVLRAEEPRILTGLGAAIIAHEEFRKSLGQ
jgi:predicted CoA-substrate-specific enzyme activase